MEQLQDIPPEVRKYNPAYEHLTWWLTEEGIDPEIALEITLRSFRFQTATTEILKAPEVGIGLTGKGREHGISTTLLFRLVWPGFVTPAEEIKPHLERTLREVFDKEIAQPSLGVAQAELNFFSQLGKDEDHHIGYIGLTKDGHEELVNGFKEAGRWVKDHPEESIELMDLITQFPSVSEEEQEKMVQRIKELSST